MNRASACVLAGLLWAVAPAMAAAADPPPAPTNDDCLMCHGDPAAARADGRPVAVNPEHAAGSIHGQSGLTCVDCHTDLATATEWPHAEKLAPAQCTTCHEPAVTAYALSVHARARENGATLAATCVDCHGSHDIRPSKDPNSRTHHLRLIETCGRCHGNADTIKAGKLQGGNVVEIFRDSIHGKALLNRGLSVAPSCSDCHGSHDIRKKGDAGSRVHRVTVPETCGTCHEGIARQYHEGVHGVQLAMGSPLAPVCSDCHSAHGIRRAEVEAWQLEVVKECGTCHEQSARTYRDTFHGQVTSLGHTRVATCADCHGAHAIFPTSDVRSMVNPAKVTQTCRACHEGATDRFAQYDPHADPHNRERNTFLYYTARFMKLLLGGVFMFFGLHTLLWFGREAHGKTLGRRKNRGSDDTGAGA